MYISVQFKNNGENIQEVFRWQKKKEQIIRAMAEKNFRPLAAEIRAILDEMLPGRGDIYERLAKQAKKNNQSPALEIREILEKKIS